MAKIFVKESVVVEPEHLPKRNNREVSSFLLYFLYSVGFVIIIMFFIIIMWGEKKGIDKDKGIMGLEKLVIMENGNILTRQVKYETSKKVDPKDTSDVFFEVVNGNDKYHEGDLVKFNHRFREIQQIEGNDYVVLDASQIQFKIKQEDVKGDLLKR